MSEKSVRTTSQKARQYIQSLTLFHNSNRQLYSEMEGNLYVVYSYGRHWPLFVNWKGIWFANKDKYSRTTTKHYGQANPLVPSVPLDCGSMRAMIHYGPTPEHIVMAAKLKLLPDELIPMVTQARIGGYHD